MITFDLPLKLVNTANVREHWRVRAARTKDQRFAAKQKTKEHVPVHRVLMAAIDGAKITITRFGPGNRKLDFSGLANSCKAVQDGIADALCMDDGDKRLTWIYRQERGPYGCRVEIE